MYYIMREWLSWWSTTLPRSGSRVRVPSRALAMKIAYAAVAQSVERRIGSAEVTGPIPVSSCEKPLCLQGFFLLSKIPGTKPGKIPIGSRHSN